MTHFFGGGGEVGNVSLKNQLNLFGIRKFWQSFETFLGLIWNVSGKLEWGWKEEHAVVKTTLG